MTRPMTYSQKKSPAQHEAMQGMMSWSFAHGSDEPFFVGGESPETFAVAAEVPLVGDFVLPIGQAVETATQNQHTFAATEPTVALLLAALLRTTEASASRRSLLTFTHNVSNVMSGRSVSSRHSVKHYEAVGAIGVSLILCANDIISVNFLFSFYPVLHLHAGIGSKCFTLSVTTVRP